MSVAIKGNPHEYFTQYKIYHLRRILTSSPVKILDYGCGIGLFSQSLFHAMPDITLHGFDVSSESIRNIPAELHTGNNLFTYNLEEIEYDYDVALLVTVLHHVPISERTQVIRNIYERLKQGGKLIIIEHNMKNPLTRKVVNNSDVDKEAIMLEPSECLALLQNTGFRDIYKRYIEFFPKQLAFMRVIEPCISWLPIGAQYMVIGQK